MVEAPHIYDAAKRHEYYLRTRHLKGRLPASPKPPTKTRAQRQAERHQHLVAEVAALKSRLEKLRAVLDQEVKKAQARSGVKTASTANKTTAQQKSNSKPQKLTAQQKAAKAKAEKKYRQENPDQQLEDQVKSLTQRIKTLQERIAKMRNDGSVGNRRNTTK